MAVDKTKDDAETVRTETAPQTPATDTKTAKAGGQTPATDAAPVDQRQRIKGILGAPEAEGRADLAQHLAFETDMSADDARAILARAPKEVAAAAAPGAEFAAVMASVENPQVGADVGDNEETPDAAATRAVESLRKLGMNL